MLDRIHDVNTVDLHGLTLHHALSVTKSACNSWWSGCEYLSFSNISFANITTQPQSLKLHFELLLELESIRLIKIQF